MRGLTPAERELLRSWVVNSDAVRDELPVLEALRALGRLTTVRVTGERQWHRTEFAHLALRVCPVE